MNCLIVEDQPPAQRILQKYIEDAGFLKVKGIFADAREAIEFLGSEDIDLIFLDIHLPGMSGLDMLKSLPRAPHVILTTAFPDYALEAYDLDVADYLLKPFSFERFMKAVSKVPRKKAADSSASQQDIFIKSGYEHIKVRIGDIRHISSDADYSEIHLPGKRLLSSESLGYWEENLDPDRFVRVHKSHIINAKHIEKVAGNHVYLGDGIRIPIGRAYKEAFIQKFLSGAR